MENNKTKLFTVFVVIALVLLLIEAFATTLFIPEFKSLFDGYGAELPSLTKFVVLSPIYIWLLPIVGVGLLIHNIKSNKQNYPILVIIILTGVLFIPFAVYSLYLPIYSDTFGANKAPQPTAERGG